MSEKSADQPNIVTFENAFADALAVITEDTGAVLSFAFPKNKMPEPWAVQVCTYNPGTEAELTTMGVRGSELPEHVQAQTSGQWQNLYLSTLCTAFAKRASTPEELKIVAHGFFRSAASKPGVELSGKSLLTIETIVQKGLAFEADEADQAGPRLIEYFLDGQDSGEPNDETKRLAGKHLYTALSKLLKGGSQAPDPQRIMQIFEEFDAAGLIADVFWNRIAIDASLDNPYILHLLHRKIASPGAHEIWAKKDTLEIANGYIVKILTKYAGDKNRHEHNSLTLLRRIRQHSAGPIDYKRLVAESNALVDRYNSQREGIEYPSYPIPALRLSNAFRDAGTAFLRALYSTRSRVESDEVKLAQHIQDIYFSDIVAFLCERSLDKKAQTARAAGSIALQHRHIKPEEMDATLRALEAGEDITVALAGLVGNAQTRTS